MLNYLWPIFLIISFIYAILVGNIDEVNKSIFDSAESAVELSITFLGTICLWNGVMKIIQSTSLIEKLTKMLNPIIKFLFKKKKKNKNGNAATPLGIKAMQTMQKDNKKKDTLSDSMVMFIVLNTASMQLIPTTVIAIRTSMESKNPSLIIIPVWIATICAAVAGIFITKILMKRF